MSIQVQYPQPFHRRVLALEAPGKAPADVLLVVPSIVAAGEPCSVRAALLDATGYPSVEFDGALEIRIPSGSVESVQIRFAMGQPAVGWVEGVVFRDEGFQRCEAELDGKTFFSNPALVQSGVEERIYWGDPHVHTVLSRCHPERCRSLNFCYAAARYMTGLDWVAAADHVSNDRCEISKWREQYLACNVYDDPPEFVTLPGYEASLAGGCGGDNNVHMLRHPRMFVDEWEGGNVKTLCEKLAEVLDPDEFFVVPHHTSRPGKHGEIPDEIYPGPDLMPVIEIHSKWGASEYAGNPNPLKSGVHDGPCYAVDLLNRGLKLGFIAGTDTHATMPSGAGDDAGQFYRLPGFTAVRAQQLTREAIFNGIRRRGCYATSLERIYLDVTVGGMPAGQSAEWKDTQKPRTIDVAAAGKSDIESIEIVRNGAVIHDRNDAGWHCRCSYTDEENLGDVWLDSKYLGQFAYYYVRVTCRSGAQAWSSPVWLTRTRG